MKDNYTISEGFKMTELSLLPEQWEVGRLGEIIEEVKEKNELNAKYPVFTVSNVYGFILSDKFFDKQVYSKQRNTYKIVRKNFFAYNPYRINVGSIGLFKSEIGLVSPAYVVFKVRNTDYFYPKFLYRLLKSSFYMSEIERIAMSRGSVRRSLSFKDLSNFEIPFPPFSEQKKIAMVLSAVQKAKEKTEAVIGAARELKKSLMKYLFTYGPVPTEEAEDIPLKGTEIGLIPEDWRIVQLGSIADFKNGINFTRNQKGKLGILTIDVLNMYGEGIYVSLNNLYRVNKEVNEDYLLRNSDILFVRSSLKREGVGWTSLFKETQEPVTFCGFIIRARLKSNDISPEFLANYLRTSNARENLIASSGKVVITNINQGMLGRILIPLPSFLTQQKIVEILSAVDKKIEAEENKRKTLEELFKTLLNNLMTAKIRVNHLEVVV